MTDTPVALTVAEVAALCNCSPATIRRAVAAGELPAVRLLGVIRIPSTAAALAPLTQPHASEPATAAASSSFCSATDRVVDAAAIGGAGAHRDDGVSGSGATDRAVGTPRPLSH